MPEYYIHCFECDQNYNQTSDNAPTVCGACGSRKIGVYDNSIECLLEKLMSIYGCSTLTELDRQIYKNTDCGAHLIVDDVIIQENEYQGNIRNIQDVTIHSIVEGSDAEYYINVKNSDGVENFEHALFEIETLCTFAWFDANT